MDARQSKSVLFDWNGDAIIKRELKYEIYLLLYHTAATTTKTRRRRTTTTTIMVTTDDGSSGFASAQNKKCYITYDEIANVLFDDITRQKAIPKS